MSVSIINRLLFSPFLAQLVVTRRCNLRCGYCNEFDRTSPPVAEDILKKRMDALKALGTFGIEFTGGEPLLNPAIFSVIAYAKKLRFFARWIITNGYLLKEHTIDALNEAGLTDMQISIDGVKPNRVTVKVLEPLRKKLELLAEKARFRVTMSAVIGSAPPEEVWEVIRFGKTKGFRPRVLLVHDGNGRLKLDQAERELFFELQGFLGKGMHEAGNYRSQLITGNPAPFKCRAGSRYLYVDEHGQVNRCSQTMKVFSKNLLDYSSKDLREQFYAHKPCNRYCTLGCARSASKLDWFRSEKKNQS